jgi:hypothetical protein
VIQAISSLIKVFDYAERRRKNRRNFRMREPCLDVSDAAELCDPSLDDHPETAAGPFRERACTASVSPPVDCDFWTGCSLGDENAKPAEEVGSER